MHQEYPISPSNICYYWLNSNCFRTCYCYSFSCSFPIQYVNGCPESKILSLNYLHLQLLLNFTWEIGTNC